MSQHKKNIANFMQQLAYRHNLWTVFSDSLELIALSISNSVDLRQFEEREKRYLDIIKSYSREEAEVFPKIFAELIMALEENPTDILGELFMELELGNKWKGQFFTPMAICKMSGAMMITGIQKHIEEKGFITVQEPAVGGGAMIIGLALAMQDAGINYQQHMVVTAVDVDLKAVHMCYIQLSLLGIPAVVCHGNMLTRNLDVYSEWKTPIYITGGWWYRKQKEPKKFEPMKLKLEDNGQFSLFDLVG